jgi:diguanylate cyclase (GGDEF)-like protein
MKIREHASQFGVFILAVDSGWGAEVKTHVSQAGYETHLLTDYVGMSIHLRAANPHVLVFSLNEVPGRLSEFIQSVLKLNPETRFVVIGETSNFDSLKSYEEYGIEQFVVAQRDHLGLRVASSVDRICEKLYYIYQNEQLLTELKGSPKQVAPAVVVAGNSIPLSSRLTAYQSSETREALIQNFFDATGIKPLVYFRFLPSISSFVATQASGFEPKDIQGVGCQVDGLSIKDLGAQVALGVVPASMLETIQKSFHIQNPRLHPLYCSGVLDGLVVYSAEMPSLQKNSFFEELSLLGLAYGYLDLQKRVELLQVQDPVTEVFNRKYYDVKILEEVERALRIKQAVSLIKISIDDFFEIEQTIGESARDLMMKKIAQLINKSNRTNDIVARTGLNEFSVILPHAHRQGALTRAERIRRVIENSMTTESGVKMSVSVGVSEYPTLCKSAGHLDETAGKALNHISGRGGNKICLFKAPADHSPEFEVPTEPG